MRVIYTVPFWMVSGVNVFCANLARALRPHGVEFTFLLTYPVQAYAFQGPTDLSLVDLTRERHPFKSEEPLRLLKEYLECSAPCIYLPGYDYSTSCVSSRLSDAVKAVGMVNSDAFYEYDHIKRLARYWNAVVAVSRRTQEKTSRLVPPGLRPVRLIHYGIDVPPSVPRRDFLPGAPLKIVYTGRLDQKQKRVFDLIRIMRALDGRKVPFELTVIGDGLDLTKEKEFRRRAEGFIADGRMRLAGALPNDRVLDILKTQDVFVLPSAFEGMSVSLLEAMAAGCVPVATAVKSGTDELIREGKNGYVVPVGSADRFAERLALLQRDPAARRQMSAQAHRTVLDGNYSIEQMAERYLELFKEVLAGGGFSPKRDGKIIRSKYIRLSWIMRAKIWLYQLLRGSRLLDPAKAARDKVRRFLNRAP